MRVLAAATVAAFFGLGCGSGGDNPEPEPVSAGKAELISKGDAVCTEMRSEQRALSQDVDDTPAAQSEAVRAIAKLHRSGMDRLDALERPGDADAVERFIAAVRSNADTLDRAADEIEANRIGKGRELITDASQNTEEVLAGMREYGFKVCGGETSG